MRKITYFLSLCLLLLMGSTTALADDYTVKKLKSIGESELISVDQIQDGQTYVLLSTYNNRYLKFDMATKMLEGVSNLDVNDNNASLSVVTFHKKTVDGDDNVYYTLEMPTGYYFPKFINKSGFSLVQANDALFQIMAITDVWSDGSNTETEGAVRGKHCFFIKSKDSDAGNDNKSGNAYLNWNAGNKYAFGFGAYGHGRFALIPVTTEGTVTNYEVTFALKEGENTLSTSTSRAWEGETADVSAINNYSTALFDLTHSHEDTKVSSTNKNFTCTLTPKADAPVVLSSADSRKWYSLQTRESVYDAGQLVADGDYVKCHGAGFNATDIASYEQFENGLWSFEQSGGGVKIYNKGKRQYLNSPDNGTGNGTGDKATFNATGTVYYMGSESDGTFNLNTGTVNRYVGSHNEPVEIFNKKFTGRYLSAWKDASSHNDPGSTFTPTSVEDILAIGSAAFGKTTPERSYTENGALNKGCYDDNAKASVSAATTFAEMEKRVNAAAANVSPEEGAYYLIRNVNGGELGRGNYNDKTDGNKNIDPENDRYKYLSTSHMTCNTEGQNASDQTLKRVKGKSDLLPLLWKFVKVEGQDGQYYLQNANMNACVNFNVVPTAANEATQKTAFTFEATNTTYDNWQYYATNDGVSMFLMKTADGAKWLNAQNGAKEGGVGDYANHNADAGNYWQFIKVTAVPLTIAANDYTTLCLPFNVRLPENSAVKAYYASDAAGEVLKLKEITGGIIPANQGVILQNTNESEVANINLTITTDEATTLTGNQLKGVTAKREGYAQKQNYVLAKGNKGIGFYKANFTAIPANKAYLPSENITNAQGVMMAFSFGDEVTGIDNVNAATPAAKKYYDLQGRRVLYPAKGIFVTEDGQKVLFK